MTNYEFKYYDFHGYEISRDEWIKAFENIDARRVGSNWLGSSQYWVSTVWTGIDYNYEKGKPLIYETVVFYGDDDIYRSNHANWDEAERGHLEAVVWTMREISRVKGFSFLRPRNTNG